MPRTARTLRSDTDYFIVSRAGPGFLLFREDSDFSSWIRILPSVQARFPGVELLAFCLLPDAMCMVVHDSGTDLGDFMRLLLGRYSRSRKDVYGTGARLYGGERFASTPLPSSEAARAALCWIHGLPREHGLVLFPEMWRWSSFRAYSSGEDMPVLTGSARASALLGSDRALFARMVDAQEPEPDWGSFRRTGVGGGGGGAESDEGPRMLPADPAGLLAKDLGVRRADLLKPRGRPLRRLRHAAFETCRQKWGMTYAEIARAFGVTPGAVIQALSAGEEASSSKKPPRREARRGAARSRPGGAVSAGEDFELKPED